ncbi:MAG: hypothetical protein ACYC0V_19785 [Armatimonadota bacterium]
MSPRPFVDTPLPDPWGLGVCHAGLGKRFPETYNRRTRFRMAFNLPFLQSNPLQPSDPALPTIISISIY